MVRQMNEPGFHCGHPRCRAVAVAIGREDRTPVRCAVVPADDGAELFCRRVRVQLASGDRHTAIQMSAHFVMKRLPRPRSRDVRRIPGGPVGADAVVCTGTVAPRRSTGRSGRTGPVAHVRTRHPVGAGVTPRGARWPITELLTTPGVAKLVTDGQPAAAGVITS